MIVKVRLVNGTIDSTNVLTIFIEDELIKQCDDDHSRQALINNIITEEIRRRLIREIIETKELNQICSTLPPDPAPQSGNLNTTKIYLKPGMVRQ